MAVERERVELVMQAQELHARRLLDLPNVVGVGTGLRSVRGALTDEVAVQVLVNRKYAERDLPDWALAPREVFSGERRVPVDVVEVGFVYAAQDTTRYRPVPGGCSIGHQSIVDAGTLGGWACDSTDSTTVLLTCNHVISGVNTASQPGGVVQPGRLDGGSAPNDLIGTLKRFLPISTIGNPPPVTAVDAAIASVTATRTDEVLAIGPAVYELGAPALNMNVKKRGRTTLLTTNGRITTVNAQVLVNYGFAIGNIGNAFIISSTDGTQFANRGDSGSLIFDQAAGTLKNTNPVVGMFFAVSNGGLTCWANDVSAIFGQLNLESICSCAARAILQAIFGTGAAAAGAPSAVELKASQLLRLRDRILAETPGGRTLLEVLGRDVAEISRLLSEDEDAFGLAVQLFAPWIARTTNRAVLDAVLDDETVANFGLLAERLARLSDRLTEPMNTMRRAVEAVRGTAIREVLESGFRPPGPS